MSNRKDQEILSTKETAKLIWLKAILECGIRAIWLITLAVTISCTILFGILRLTVEAFPAWAFMLSAAVTSVLLVFRYLIRKELQ